MSSPAFTIPRRQRNSTSAAGKGGHGGTCPPDRVAQQIALSAPLVPVQEISGKSSYHMHSRPPRGPPARWERKAHSPSLLRHDQLRIISIKILDIVACPVHPVKAFSGSSSLTGHASDRLPGKRHDDRRAGSRRDPEQRHRGGPGQVQSWQRVDGRQGPSVWLHDHIHPELAPSGCPRWSRAGQSRVWHMGHLCCAQPARGRRVRMLCRRLGPFRLRGCGPCGLARPGHSCWGRAHRRQRLLKVSAR